jgi:hypothetical protein
MTSFPDLFIALAAPFDAVTEVKLKPVGGGKSVPYATARVYMNRLDDVLGPENWEDWYVDLGEDSYQAFLKIRLPDGRWVTKQDCGAKSATISDEDGEKAGISDGFKRVCAKFGVGRYLYGDGVAEITESKPKNLAVCMGAAQPTNGGALWAWCKEASQKFSVDLCQKLTEMTNEIGQGLTIPNWGVGETSEAFSRLAVYLAELGLISSGPPVDPPRTVPFRSAGPLSISKDDPLKVRKLAIKEKAKEVTYRWENVVQEEGVVLEQDQVMGIITRVLAERRPIVKCPSIRDCRQDSILQEVERALDAELGQLRQLQDQA